MENEMKIFMLVRSDLLLKASDLVPALATAFYQHKSLCDSIEMFHERSNFYFNVQPAFPKICKRFKQSHVSKIELSLQTLELPVAHIKIDNETVGYIIGPAYRNELPKNIDKLQLMQDCLITIDESDNDGKVIIGYRGDIEIPAGKLIPQFGHAIQKFLCENTSILSILPFSVKKKTLDIIKDEGNYIIDAGRTYFDKPTITTNYKYNH